MKANGFLKVTGVLMIIFGAIGVIVSLIAVLGIVALTASGYGSTLNSAMAATGYSPTLLIAASVLSIISSVVLLVAGILGVANAARPEKATICIVFGLLTIILGLCGGILSAVSGGSFFSFSLVSGLVLSILYVLGAYQNKGRA